MLSWDEWCACLEALVAEHMTIERAVDGTRLGTYLLCKWVDEQSREYQKGKLSTEQRERLEAIPGWKSTLEDDDHWNEAFKRLSLFTTREGHSQVPLYYQVDCVALGVWVAEQRRLHGLGELQDTLRQKLESLKGWSWWSKPITYQ